MSKTLRDWVSRFSVESLERRLMLYNTYDGEPKWGFNDITYSFTNALDGGLQGVSVNQIRTVTAEALAMWTAVTPLRFRENIDPNPSLVTDETYDGSGLPIIRIGQHNMGGPSGELAHAWRPDSNGRGGDMHFDITESWTFGASPSNPYNMLEVAAHEIGHAIGLDHEGVNTALMNPNYANRYGGSGTGALLADDIAGIQHLYGAGLGYVIDVFGNMWVAGTSGVNTLSLSYNSVNSTISVVSNGFGSFSRSISGINKITFLGSGGSDVFNIGRVPFSVEVDGGTGSDQLNLFGYDTSNSYFLTGNTVVGHSISSHSNIESMSLWGSNTAGDFFTVNSAPTIPVTLNGQGGGDNITLHALSTNLAVNPDTGNDTIEINEPSAPIGAPTITLNAGDGDDLFRVTRLDRGLVLNCGIGNDTVDIARGATVTGAVLGSIVVNGFDGNDVVNVAPNTVLTNATTAAISVFGGNDNDTLNLGGGSVSSVGGSVSSDGGTHTGPGNTININDTARTSDVPWFVTTTDVHRGLAGPDVTYSNTSRIILNCGSGHDDITVASGVNPIVEVYGNNGNDEFIVGGGLMDAGAGPIVGAFNGGNGTDQITYDDHLRTTGVIWDVRPTAVYYGGIFQLNTAGFEAVGILAGSGDDDINLYDEIDDKLVSVDGASGNDSFDLIACRAYAVTMTGGLGNDYLNVDDRNLLANIEDNYFHPDRIERYSPTTGITHTVHYSSMRSMDFKLRNAQNFTTIYGTPADIDPAYAINIRGNSAEDAFVVIPRDAGGNATLAGNLIIDGLNGADSLSINDGASSVPTNYVFSNPTSLRGQISGMGAGYLGFWNTLESLTLNAGISGDAFTLTSYKNGVPLAINAGAGADVLTFGNGNLGSDMAAASFNFNGGADSDTYFVANSNSTGAHAYYVVPGLFSTYTPAGFALPTDHSGFELVSAWAGSSGDNFSIWGTNPGDLIEVNGGGGNDVYQFGSIFPTNLQSIRSLVRVNGGAGADNIGLYNYDDNIARTYHVTSNTVSAAPGDNLFGAGGSLEFNSVAGTMTIENGSGADTVYAQPNVTTTLAINGGNPTTAPGDVLKLALAAAQNLVVNGTPASGSITSSNLKTLSYTGFETLQTDAVAPVASASFAVDPQQTLAVQFSEVMGTIPSPTSITLKKLSPTLSIPAASMSAVTTSTSLTLTFPGYPQGLPDGNYRLTVPSTSALDLMGNSLATTFTHDFFVLAGDANRDRSVDTVDFGILALNFAQVGKVFTQGNFDYDPAGDVSTIDFGILAANFGKVLAGAGESLSALPAAAGVLPQVNPLSREAILLEEQTDVI